MKTFEQVLMERYLVQKAGGNPGWGSGSDSGPSFSADGTGGGGAKWDKSMTVSESRKALTEIISNMTVEQKKDWEILSKDAKSYKELLKIATNSGLVPNMAKSFSSILFDRYLLAKAEGNPGWGGGGGAADGEEHPRAQAWREMGRSIGGGKTSLAVSSYKFKGESESTVSGGYKTLNNSEAMAMHNDQIKGVPADTIHDIEYSYCANSQSFSINNALRNDDPFYKEKYGKTINNIQTSMRPLPQDMELVRTADSDYWNAITSGKNFSRLERVNSSISDGKVDPRMMDNIKTHLIGMEIQEKGFMSTSWKPDNSAFESTRRVSLKILAPKGTSAYVTNNLNESEVILAAGSKYKIIDVGGEVVTESNASGRTQEWKPVITIQMEGRAS